MAAPCQIAQHALKIRGEGEVKRNMGVCEKEGMGLEQAKAAKVETDERDEWKNRSAGRSGLLLLPLLLVPVGR